MRTFRDRIHAGDQLGRLLGRRPGSLVVGLPRGGVVVAAGVAAAVDGDLDVLMVRKLGFPRRPELAFGAIGEGGNIVYNEDLAGRIADTDRQSIIERERAELDRRVRDYRDGAPMPPFAGRTVILVDDGLATGATARAAVAVARNRAPDRLVLALPVAAAQARSDFELLVDEYVVVMEPANLMAVGYWYEDFAQVSDAEVRRLLAAR